MTVILSNIYSTITNIRCCETVTIGTRCHYSCVKFGKIHNFSLLQTKNVIMSNAFQKI